MSDVTLIPTATGLSFGEAVEAAKADKLIARAGWNGKGMFVFQRPEDTLSADVIPKVKSLPASVKEFLIARAQKFAAEKLLILAEIGVTFGAYLCMFTADGSIANGWLASQTDMLATDWQILEMTGARGGEPV